MNTAYITGYFDGEGCVFCNKTSNHGWPQVHLSFANTHLASLKAIQSFLGCGHIYKHPGGSKSTKPCYLLAINAWKDVLRVCEQMQPDAIVKKDKIEQAIAMIKEYGWYNHRLDMIDPQQIIKAYRNEGESLERLGWKYDVSPSTVRDFLVKHGMPIRPMGKHFHRLYGEDNPNSKLTGTSVREIRTLLNARPFSAKTMRTLAQKYGVSESAIEAVASGRNWHQPSFQVS